MTLGEIKKKTLVLIEEYDDTATDENGKAKHTSDEDIYAKMNSVVNQIMFECCRIKKIAKYIEVAVNKGDVLDFSDLERECGYEVFQVGLISGVDYVPRAEGRLFKMLDSGTAEIDLYVYPERITDKTSDSYEFELSADILEIMPYGIAGDLLSSDVSNNYGNVYKNRYEMMLSRLDTRSHAPGITFEGGVL
jgi:hypothetical protein